MYSSENSAPVISDQEFTVAENSAIGTEVGTVAASDPNSDDLTFNILSGNTEDAFSIDTSTGLLTVNNSTAIDYETTTSFALIVEVSDGSLESNATITVNVDNVNSLSPIASSFEFKAYPNPVESILNISKPSNCYVEIYSVIGVKILETKDYSIDLSYLDKGVYFIVLKNEAGKSIKSLKILKK
ncbi:cadherin domain-containing protein [Bacteroidota bacterium]